MRRACHKLALYCVGAAFAALSLTAQDYPTADQLAAQTYTQSMTYEVLPTGSMRPTFDENWILLVRKTPFGGLKVGDMIIYRAPRGLLEGACQQICHRIVGRSSGGSALILCGDANHGVCDPLLVTESMYVGRVVGLIEKPRPE